MPDNYPGGDTCQTPGCSQPQEFHFNGFLFYFLKTERKRVKAWLSLSLVLGGKERSRFPKALSLLGTSIQTLRIGSGRRSEDQQPCLYLS